MLQFKTIRQTAATGLISEYRLRILVAEGRCPGIYAGNRFLVNVEALKEILDRQSINALTNTEQKMKKYIVKFSGFYIVEADSGEEALETSQDDAEYAEWQNDSAVLADESLIDEEL